MKPDFTFTLTDNSTKPAQRFEFTRYETPEYVPFGGEQMLAVHTLVGGYRVVDAMGRSDMPLAWQGLFYGEGAEARANFLNYWRRVGIALDLAWSKQSYQVVIGRFEANFERRNQIPYRIECIPIKSYSDPISGVPSSGIDNWIREDNKKLSALGLPIGDDPLSKALGVLDTAVKGVSDFAKATTETIRAVLGPLAVVQQRIGILVSTTSNTLGNVSTLGGIIPGNPVSQALNRITSKVSAATSINTLYNMQSVANRMGSNLTLSTTSGKTIVQAGGDLYRVASDNLGSAAEWAGIARANGLTDPKLTGIQQIRIPTNQTTGGVLQK